MFFFFFKNGSLLLSQFLHDNPVLRLKCRTWQSYKNHGTAEQVWNICRNRIVPVKQVETKLTSLQTKKCNLFENFFDTFSLTLYTLTSVCIPILFFIHFLNC